MKLLIRWVLAGLGLFAAAYLVPGIHVDDPNAWTVYALMALILGLVNALIRPILKLLSCPLILLTLGLFLLVINGLSFLIAARIAENLGLGFRVDGFTAALLGGLVVSAVSLLGTLFFREENE
jgi:putative membrane protein